jgi:hypothetical protein
MPSNTCDWDCSPKRKKKAQKRNMQQNMIISHYCGSSLVSVVVLIAVLSFLGLLQQQLFSSATFIRSLHTHECNNIVHPNFVVLQSSQLLSSSNEEENELSSRSSKTTTKTTTTTITTSTPRIQQQHNTPEEIPIFQEIPGPFQPHLFTTSWTRHPLLIRNAFPITSSWPTIHEIQTLASEEDAEVRLITQLSSTYYGLTIGGYDPSSDYNNRSVVLLVNDVDRFLPTLSDWISETFSFLPTWRMDDGQMSYSPRKGATIGRHVDNYDVFCKLFLHYYHTKEKVLIVNTKTT